MVAKFELRFHDKYNVVDRCPKSYTTITKLDIASVEDLLDAEKFSKILDRVFGNVTADPDTDEIFHTFKEWFEESGADVNNTMFYTGVGLNFYYALHLGNQNIVLRLNLYTTVDIEDLLNNSMKKLEGKTLFSENN